MGQEKPTISYEEFSKLDLRVANVLEVREHPNADRLLVLTIDLGSQQRQIIAAIKPWYPAETLVGKQIVVVTNLEPRKVRGMESNGMLLAASKGEPGHWEDVVVLVTDRELPPGSPVS